MDEGEARPIRVDRREMAGVAAAPALGREATSPAASRRGHGRVTVAPWVRADGEPALPVLQGLANTERAREANNDRFGVE